MLAGLLQIIKQQCLGTSARAQGDHKFVGTGARAQGNNKFVGTVASAWQQRATWPRGDGHHDVVGQQEVKGDPGAGPVDTSAPLPPLTYITIVGGSRLPVMHPPCCHPSPTPILQLPAIPHTLAECEFSPASRWWVGPS